MKEDLNAQSQKNILLNTLLHLMNLNMLMDRIIFNSIFDSKSMFPNAQTERIHNMEKLT